MLWVHISRYMISIHEHGRAEVRDSSKASSSSRSRKTERLKRGAVKIATFDVITITVFPTVIF